MWKIIKAQINFNKIVLVIGLLMTLAVVIPFIVQGWKVIDESYPALRAVLFATTAIVFLSSSVKNVKEKRRTFIE